MGRVKQINYRLNKQMESKQLIYTTNIATKKTTQQLIRGQPLPRSVSFRNQDNLYQQEQEQERKQVQEQEQDQHEDKSKNAMEDLIGEDGQQQSSRQALPVVVKHNLVEEAKADDYHYKSQQQQNQEASQYYDGNNNDENDNDNDNKSNNNSFNSSKVRLLITPAAVVLPKVYGSKQQQMAYSGQQNTTNLQANNNNNNFRSQQSRQKNYHHYDYYTDSELTSSQEQQNPNEQQLNHYDDENILLFATEHDNNKPKNVRKSSSTSGGNQQRGVTKTTPEKQQQLPFPQKNSSTRINSTNHQYSSLYNNAPQQTGKFVNYYPSWRQTQSPTSHYQNYSFHVPSMNQHHHLNPSQQQLYQPRYSFVAPVERIYVTPGGRFKQSFKSQTISHLPTMMKVSVEETTTATTTKANKTTPIMLSPNNTYNNIGASSFEDFYDKPSYGYNTNTANDQYLMKSDRDLLKAHVVDLRHDQGFDNPFKPGTELSWEAEMMVRLMKRGYPIQELPILVETAKHLARERQKINNYNSLSRINNSSAREYIDNEGILNANNEEQQVVSMGKKPTNSKAVMNQVGTAADSSNKRNQKSENFIRLKRQSSQNDLNLSSGKQVWANSLSRTKSMPKFSSATNQTSNKAQYDVDCDTDSIDKLITSIENEMADLIGGAGSEEDGDDNKRLISKLSNDQNKVANIIKVPKGQNKSEKRFRNGGGSTNEVKVNDKLRLKEVNKSSNSKNYKNSATTSRNNNNNNNKPDLNETNTKIKVRSGKNRCCIIQ